MTDPDPWWRHAVVYQTYIRSFADGSGDGVGDISGLRSRLPYLRDLGVDAVWVNPWFVSPMVDGGYDVADYREIDPTFGTLAGAETFIAEAHDVGIKVLLDVVPNHTSDRHPWFRAALAAGPGSPERDRYIFRDGRGRGGGRPPTDWPSVFGGSAWARVTEPDGRAGQWFLHLFAPEQPDLDWTSTAVRDEFESILRYWFERGADGFRIDVAHGLVKDPALPDLGKRSPKSLDAADHPYWDREGVHDIYRRWRAIADEYDGRVFVAEIFVSSAERLARYLRSDELHSAFDFRFLLAGWDAVALRQVIDDDLRALGAVGAVPTWVLSNHDQVRHVTRFSRIGRRRTDVALGRRRARAALLLMLALPGCAYLYQGEELGLEEVEDLPEALLQDPTWARSGHTVRGRDGCRVPLPWSGTAPPFGFGPPGSSPWLPQPASWRERTAEAQTGDPASFLELYRAALGARREHLGFRGAGMAWLPSPEAVLRFDRPGGLETIVNLGTVPLELPAGRPILLASEPLAESGLLAPDTAVWLG
jgi:alpha-glucosidase